MTTVYRILFKSILYTSPVWLLLVYMEFQLSRMENSYSYKWKNFDAIAPNCELLILGNSEMLKGCNPDYFPMKAFNMAHVSQSFTIDEAILEAQINQMPKLKTVVLGLTYISFGEDLQSNEEAWRLPFYQKHYGLHLDHSFTLSDYSAFLRYTPYESLKLMTHNFNADMLNGMQANGWMKTVGCQTNDTSIAHALTQASNHNKTLKQENIKKNTKALQKIFQLLKERNITIWLVQPPVMPAYQKALQKNWMAKNDSIIQTLAVDHTFKKINYTDSFEVFNSINGFNDVNHLNESGAHYFSTSIANLIRNY